MNVELLKELTEVNGISGHEKRIKKIMERELNGHVDSMSEDNLGSFISNKKGNGPKIMLAAHMDEVGFIVKYIDDNGFIFFEPVGGWWNQVMLAQKVTITTSKDKEIYGVIGSKPPHVLGVEERKKTVDMKDMFIDIGVSSKEEVINSGILVGDMITPYAEFMEMENSDYLMAKAFDNRIGCYIVIEVMKRLEKENLNADVYGVATVQEEIGLRGAKTSADIINPDIAIAVDTGIAGDTPKMTIDEAQSKIGKGPQIIVMDRSTFGNVDLRKKMLEVAFKHDIDTQLDFVPGGGTDAGNMHLAHDGAQGMSISIATRYIHSHLSIIHKKDVEQLIELLTQFCLEVK